MRDLSPVSTPASIRALQTCGLGALALVMVILSGMPVGGNGTMSWVPNFPLIFLFFWTVRRPDLFPRWLAFVMGLMQDILLGGPLGLWTMVYVMIYEGVYGNRLFFIGRAAYSSFFGFLAAAGGAGVIAWAIACVYFWQPVTPLPLIGQTIATVLAYPVVAWLLSRIDRMLGNDL